MSVAEARSPNLYDGTGTRLVQLPLLLDSISAGDVVLVTEQHGNWAHSKNQIAVIDQLIQLQKQKTAYGITACTVSVGLEFLEKQDQNFVDQFFAGALNETDFLKQIKWGSIPFDHYRVQAALPHTGGGRLFAINADRKLTGRVAKVGISGLTVAESAQLPSGFQLGRASYRRRFADVMAQHVPASALQRYFEAQSIWDEVMADESTKILKQRPTDCLVIVVGDFHGIYGGGLPARLRARGVRKVKVISQIDSGALSNIEEQELFNLDPDDGMRADAVFVSRENRPELPEFATVNKRYIFKPSKLFGETSDSNSIKINSINSRRRENILGLNPDLFNAN